MVFENKFLKRFFEMDFIGKFEMEKEGWIWAVKLGRNWPWNFLGDFENGNSSD